MNLIRKLARIQRRVTIVLIIAAAAYKIFTSVQASRAPITQDEWPEVTPKPAEA